MHPLSRLAVFILGFVLGLALWSVPAFLFGAAEPWNGQGPAYAIALVGAGLLLGFFGPGQLFGAAAGVFSGQLVVLLGRVLSNPGSKETWMVSVVLLAGYTVVATSVGAALGSVMRRKLRPIERGQDRRSH